MVLRRWQGGRLRGDRGLARVDRHCILPGDRKGRPLRIGHSKDEGGGGIYNEGGEGLQRTCFSARVGARVEDKSVWS